MLSFLRPKKSVRFVLTTLLLTSAAIVSAVFSALSSQAGQFEIASISSKIALGLAIIIFLYVVPQLARNIHWKSNYAVQVPNAGLIFSVAILLVTILSLGSGNNLLYIVLSALLATMIFSMISARLNLSALLPSVRFPNHIFVGESVAFETSLKSDKRLLPSFSLSVDIVEEHRSTSTDSKTTEQRAVAIGYFPLLPAKSQSSLRIERIFKQRGIYPINGFVINTGFPFGFIEQRRFIEWPSEIVVYPQPQTATDFLDLLPKISGRVESYQKGTGSELHAIRQYLTSDHHHNIDWKATAKTGRLMVREFTRDDDWRITIFFGTGAVKEIFEEAVFMEKFERAVTLAASLADHFIQKAEVQLITADEISGFGRGQTHLYKILRILAQLSPQASNEENFKRFPEAHGNSLEFFIFPGNHKAPKELRKHSRHFINFEDL